MGTDIEVQSPSEIPYEDDPNFITQENEVSTRITTSVPGYMGTCFVIDSNDNYFICCQTPNNIKKVTPDGQTEIFWTGNNNYPAHITIDKNDNLFISRKGGTPPYEITKITPEGVESEYWSSTESPGPITIDSNNDLICVIYNQNDPAINTKICRIKSDNSQETIIDLSPNIENKVINNFNITSITTSKDGTIYVN